ncbi:hypothetical protein NDU88_005817 [Pleurodeles waltl]|uniref:Uncharacterized protein n=1 Tax=Pleurodeles waltl TaxID=8319 RepID=A0AAV7MXI8_PLEWA|nr:hypothetical protein NDU88_005817 [Pleurodeles waltl]
MLLDAQVDLSRHPYTPSRPLRSVIKRAISEALAAAAGITGFLRLLSHVLKTSMAPKTTRNLGDKTEVVKMTHVGRDKGELVGVNKSLTSIIGSPKGWSKATGKDLKLVDWGKDSSDKFYSLTEESDLSSSNHSFGESDAARHPRLEINHQVMRQLRRQWKSVKSRLCSQEDFENLTSTGGRTLKWDYSGIGLADTPTTSNQGSVNGNMEAGTGAPASNPSAMGTEAGMLQSIYSSIKELQKETRIESRRARIATKRLQGTVHKVAKSCTEIEAKLCSMEERIVAVEEDVDNLKEQSATRDDQLTDVMWKLEDFKNRQRRNNL